jgi:glucosamine-6-phosphate deaminase
MATQLFNHIDILSENIYIPSGEILRNDVDQFCKDYEQKIVEAGGIDLHIIGIGRTGDLGFNDPPSRSSSMTRLVHLERSTRQDISGSFNGEENVPKHAITMGI